MEQYMSTELDKYLESYQEKNMFSLDNKLMLNWYPKRVFEFAKGDSLLELGLGHGHTALNFCKYFEKYTIIEGSKEIINLFNSKNPDLHPNIVLNYFENYQADEKFDNILMGFILEHVDDPIFILKKYKDFLKPNGSVFITVPNTLALNKRYGYHAGLIDDLNKLTRNELDFGHKRLFTVESISKMVEETGYKIERIEGIFLKPITTSQIKQLNMSEEILQSMLKVGIDYPELCVSLFMEIKL